MADNDQKPQEPMFIMDMELLIPHRDDCGFTLPEDPQAWKAEVLKELEDTWRLPLKISTIQGGGEVVQIAFGEGKQEFSFSVHRVTLERLIHALQLAHDNPTYHEKSDGGESHV